MSNDVNLFGSNEVNSTEKLWNFRVFLHQAVHERLVLSIYFYNLKEELIAANWVKTGKNHEHAWVEEVELFIDVCSHSPSWIPSYISVLVPLYYCPPLPICFQTSLNCCSCSSLVLSTVLQSNISAVARKGLGFLLICKCVNFESFMPL